MSWNRIRGQNAARQLLLNAMERGRLAHAYFLVGPEGVGKSLFARELTKALLCEQPATPLSCCDQCAACQQVNAGTHPDVLILRTPEGKHELPVEEMRKFCSQLSQAPSRGGRKVGIIEDADEFNPESANSFLKTLEEPPPNTTLLLIASSTAQQLPTILSRCQIVRFSPLSPADLSEILAKQGISDPERRERLVKLAGGSVSRALALNDDAIWKVREELLAGITAERPNFFQLSSLWSKFVEEAGKESKLQRNRASVVIGFLIDALRQALRLSLGSEVHGIDPANERRLRSLADRLGSDRLIELIEKCLEADYRVERRVQLVLVIEAVMAQFAQ